MAGQMGDGGMSSSKGRTSTIGVQHGSTPNTGLDGRREGLNCLGHKKYFAWKQLDRPGPGCSGLKSRSFETVYECD